MGIKKNVASQKIRVFAFADAGHASLDAGEPVTGDAANITAKVAKDWGTATAITDTNPTEVEDGYYLFDLTQTETNADVLDFYPQSSTAGVQVIAVPGTVYTVPQYFSIMAIDSNGRTDVGSWNGSTTPVTNINTVFNTDFATNYDGTNDTWLVRNAGTIQTLDALDTEQDTQHSTTQGRLPAALVSGRMDCSVGAMAANVLTATAINTGAITSAKFASGAITSTVIASSAIGASQIASNAFTSAKYDATAGNFPHFGIIDQGTAQSATSTTLVLRAAATFANSEINGAWIVITGGTTGVGQVRRVKSYVGSTDTATVDTWTTTPTGTITYKIFAAPPLLDVNVSQFGGSGGSFSGGIPAVNTTQIEGSDATDQIRDAVVDDATRIDASALNTASAAIGSDGTGLTEAGGTGDHLSAIIGADADTLKTLSDQIDGISASASPQLLQNTTITGLSSQTVFNLTAGSGDNDAYNGAVAIITDQSTSTQKAFIPISDYVGSTRTVTLSAAPAFTIANGDTIDIIAAASDAPTAAAIRAEIDSNSTQLAAIVADTNELQGDLTNGGRLDLILDGILEDTAEIGVAGAGLTEAGGTGDQFSYLPTAADNAGAVWDEPQASHPGSGTFGEIATEIASILADTNELQGDWTNAGRLDSILDTIAADVVNIDGAAMRGTDNAFLAASAPTNFSSLVISGAGAVDSLVQGFLNNTIAETTADNISANFETFFDNADSLTSQTVDDVGGGGGGGDATAANQSTIITHLTDIKGTGFAKDTHSLPQCLTATGFSTFNAGSDTITVGGISSTALALFVTTDTGETTAADGSVAKIAQGSAGGNVTVGAMTQAALAQFATDDTGETDVATGSVAQLSRASSATGTAPNPPGSGYLITDAEFLKRTDWRLMAELCADGDVVISTSAELIANVNYIALKHTASARVKAAMINSGRFTEATIFTVASLDFGFIYQLVCDLMVCLAYRRKADRRPEDYPPFYEQTFSDLEALKLGDWTLEQG